MKKLLVVLFVASIFTVQAQRIKIVSGNLDFLKGQTELNLEYDYSDMSVGKYDDEQDYIEKKVQDYNEDEPGKGDEWREAWVEDRATRFQPKFEELFDKYIEKVDLTAAPDLKDAKYTMILHTTFTEPGWNIGISRSSAYINAEAIFVETANPDNILCKINIKKAPGRDAMGYDFDTGSRIGEAYAKCGKSLSKFVYKKIK